MELPINLGGYLGLRREEIAGLEGKAIDLDGRILRIVKVRTSAGAVEVVKAPKTETSRRTLYITDELLEVLLKVKNHQSEMKRLLGDEYIDTDYVYVHDNGKTYRVNTITGQFKAFLEKHEFPPIRLHDLRHTFASILHDEGVDLKAISEALGHSDLATTNKIYTYLFDETHKKTVSVMSRALGRKKEERD